MLEGSFVNIGAFDQCLSLKSTQYCLMFIKIPLQAPRKMEGIFRPLSKDASNFRSEVFRDFSQYIHFFHYTNLTIGLCVPKTCLRHDVRSVAGDLAKHYGLQLSVDVDVCQSKELAYPLLNREIVSLVVITSILILNLVGFLGAEPSLLKCFDFARNFRKILAPPPKTRLPILDGLKSLNMVLMITVHVIFLLPWVAQEHGLESTKISSSPLIIAGLLGPFTIETFFLITGLENMMYFKRCDRKFRPIPYLLAKYLRFAPSIGVMICLYILTFSDHVRNLIGGPFWPYYKAAGSLPQVCARNWPGHLLLIAHYFSSVSDINICLITDWYLEADFLFSILLILVIQSYIKGRRKLSIGIATLMVVIGCLILASLTTLLDIQSSWLPLNFEGREFIKYAIYIHTKPWGHVSAYFLGVLLAFALSREAHTMSYVSLQSNSHFTDPNRLNFVSIREP